MGEFDWLCELPAGAPPSGGTSNFVNPSVTLVPEIIAVSAFFMTISLVFVVGSLYAVPGKFSLANWFILVAYICSVGQAGLLFAQLKWARHIWDVRACWFFGNYAELIFSQQMLLIPGQFLSKASILLLIQSIFNVTGERHLQIALFVGHVWNALVYLPSFGIEAYFNAPAPGTDERWETLMATGKPEKAIVAGVVQSAMAIVQDLYIFILPIPSIMKLKMSPRKRKQVIAVFSTALMAVIACIISLVFRVFEMKHINDSTWNLYIILLCTVVELNVAIIVASVPGFSRFVRVHLLHWPAVKSIQSKFSSYISNSTNTGPSNAKTWPMNITTTAQGESRDAPQPPPIELDNIQRHHQYYELNNNDSWLMQTGNSTINEGSPYQEVQRPAAEGGGYGGIVRTVDVEQQAYYQQPSSSAYNFSRPNHRREDV
ncbi:hypothetical protein QBC38DRAFT_489724 [Podospora fimiseda]|uniref:Rhodopsin domain-containing protein n=1 Tax=Podospora fimiseda TaxID=252190 RepID=A0AAN6YNI3_9PEZI|nr:hypothetical protein QBC38DRAFT_489724 [Podospora fimiseda]